VVREKFFGAARPASTLVEVSALILPELKVEIEAVAGDPGLTVGPVGAVHWSVSPGAQRLEHGMALRSPRHARTRARIPRP
jgi:hypothetical protein